jgi:hypothetical protein
MSISYKVSDAREAYKLLVRIHTEWLLTSDPHENYLIGVAAAEIARLRAVEDSVANAAQIAPDGVIDAENDKTALAALEHVNGLLREMREWADFPYPKEMIDRVDAALAAIAATRTA